MPLWGFLKLPLSGVGPLLWGVRVNAAAGCDGRRSVLDDLEYDDSESPAIGLVRAGVSWEDLQDHIKISHQPLLVLPEDSAQYAGAYWTGTKMIITDDLGSDQDQAICEFRDILRERGET
jgi:hypothetical protein